jgi:hypothetical protein
VLCMGFSHGLPSTDNNPLLSVLLRTFLPANRRQQPTVCLWFSGSSFLPSFLPCFLHSCKWPTTTRPAQLSICYVMVDQIPHQSQRLYVTWLHVPVRVLNVDIFLIVPAFLFPGNFYLFVVFLAKQLGTFWKFLFFYPKLDYFCLIFWRKFANFLKLKNWEKKAYCWSAIWFLVANSLFVGKDLCIYFNRFTKF